MASWARRRTDVRDPANSSQLPLPPAPPASPPRPSQQPAPALLPPPTWPSALALALPVPTARRPPHHRPRTSQLVSGVVGNGRLRSGISDPFLAQGYYSSASCRFLTPKNTRIQKCSDLKISFAVRTGRPFAIQSRRIQGSSPPGCAATAPGWTVAARHATLRHPTPPRHTRHRVTEILIFSPAKTILRKSGFSLTKVNTNWT